MKKSRVNLIALLFSFTAIISGQSNLNSIEGLLYIDETPVIVKITDGKITDIERLSSGVDVPEMYIAPGFVDLQINGYMGVDFTGNELTLDGVRTATKALWKEGVTTFLLTVITNTHETLLHSFTILAQAMADPEIGNSIPGFHLEGPYISPVKGFRGAHLEKYIRLPDWTEFMEYQKAADGGIKLVTVAPEVEGAILFIRKSVEEGIIVSIGHHNGSAENIQQAIDAGTVLATHLGNGCANMINRHHNPLWPQLADDRLNISIIVDGYHLTKEEVITFHKVKGTGNTILISDALDLAGLEPGEYIRGERKVLLTPNVIKFPAENVLAGAASPIRICVGNMMRFTKCSLKDAIRMASTNPSKLLNLLNIGEIRSGKRADLIVFTIENGNIIIQKTLVAGKLVYSRN